MKSLLFCYLALSMTAAMASEILDRVPEGRYKGKNSDGTCWVFSRPQSDGRPYIVVSKVAADVRPMPGDSLSFAESSYYETGRNSTPETLTVKNVIVPDDSYTRTEEVTLAVKNQATKKTVTISSREKYAGIWINKKKLSCTIQNYR